MATKKRSDRVADDEREHFTIVVGAMTLGEYLHRDPFDDMPTFVSPRWLHELDQRGLLNRKADFEGPESA
jgi:hypothetical protein